MDKRSPKDTSQRMESSEWRLRRRKVVGNVVVTVVEQVERRGWMTVVKPQPVLSGRGRFLGWFT